MTSILYYSNFCEHSKKAIKYVSSDKISKDIHFICIDKRERGSDGKTYIILENSQKIVMPENVTRVPAVLLLNNNYQVLYGDDIYKYFKPKIEESTRQVTQNNMEPMAFSFSGGASITSDQYSFLDMSSDELNTKGNGGVRQMHNYVTLNHVDTINTPSDDHDYKGQKTTDGMTMEELQNQRARESENIQYITKN